MLLCTALLFSFGSCKDKNKTNAKTDATPEETVETPAEPVELNAYFLTKLENINGEIEDYQTRLDGLETRIEEVSEKVKKPEHEAVITHFEDEWADIFNANNEINLVAQQAEVGGVEDLLTKAEEQLIDVNAKIESLDLALFKAEPLIKKGKPVPANLLGGAVAQSKPTNVETTSTNPTKEESKKPTTKPTKTNENPSVKKPDVIASTSNNIIDEPVIVPKTQPQKPVIKQPEPEPEPVYEYDPEMGQIVLDDCKRLKKKLESVSSAAKKLTSGSNKEYASMFAQDKKEMDGAIEQAKSKIAEVERLVATANSEKNTDKVFSAKRKTSGISKEISKAGSISEMLAKKVDVENKKKADIIAANKKKEAEAKAEADAKAAADAAKADADRITKEEAEKAEADRIAKEEAEKAAAATAAATAAAAAASLGAVEHPPAVKESVGGETIQKLMKLSPDNRDRSLSTSIESYFADAYKETITVTDGHNNSKKYSAKDYVKKMMISGPFYIEVKEINLNQNQKIVGLVLTDTKVQ